MSAISDEHEFAHGFHSGYQAFLAALDHHSLRFREGVEAGCHYAIEHTKERGRDWALIERNERSGR